MSSKFLKTSSEKDGVCFKKRSRSVVFNMSPHLPPDFNSNAGAWGILIAHHKHYNRDEYDTWIYEDAVKILQREIDLGKMEKSMENVVAKLKRQEDIFASTLECHEDNADVECKGVEDSIENSRAFTVGDENDYEDFNKFSIDPLLLKRPLCVGASIASPRQFALALKFIQNIKEQRELKAASKLMEFAKNDSDLSVDEIRMPSIKIKELNQLYSKMAGVNGKDQSDAFNVIVAHLLEQDCCKTLDNPSGQLRMFISGEGGTGKSFLVNSIRVYARIHYGYDGTKHGPVLVVAPTGVAANNIEGSTIDYACYTWQYSKHESDAHFLSKLQNNLGLIKLLIIDEVSMLGARQLGKLDKIFHKATLNYDKFMGGVHFVFLGDWYQLPPVFRDTLYRQNINKLDDMYLTGVEVYRSCTCYKELVFNFRQLEEASFLQTLRRVRVGQSIQADCDLFATRTRKSVESNDISSLPPDTMFVASRHITCDAGNIKHIEVLEKEGYDVVDCWAVHTRPNTLSHSKKKAKSIMTEEEENIDIDAGETEQFKSVSNLHLNNATDIEANETFEILKHKIDLQAMSLEVHLRLCLNARVLDDELSQYAQQLKMQHTFNQLYRLFSFRSIKSFIKMEHRSLIPLQE